MEILLQRAKYYFLSLCPIPPERIEIRGINSIYLEFRDLEDFNAMYEKDLRIYTFLLDKILKTSNPELILNDENKFLRKDGLTDNKANSDEDEDSENDENYMVLRYRSNYLEPIRKNYAIVHHMNQLLGVQIMTEELHDGFIRFIKTRADFESMFVGKDEVKKWIQFFEVLQLDITHPTIVKFLEIIKSYLN
ncbi:MAG: hypothetical protein ACTSYI_15435 [Promethearchaeota archaeon]